MPKSQAFQASSNIKSSLANYNPDLMGHLFSCRFLTAPTPGHPLVKPLEKCIKRLTPFLQTEIRPHVSKFEEVYVLFGKWMTTFYISYDSFLSLMADHTFRGGPLFDKQMECVHTSINVIKGKLIDLWKLLREFTNGLKDRLREAILEDADAYNYANCYHAISAMKCGVIPIAVEMFDVIEGNLRYYDVVHGDDVDDEDWIDIDDGWRDISSDEEDISDDEDDSGEEEEEGGSADEGFEIGHDRNS